MGQADLRMAGHDEALRLGEGERAVEIRPADMLDRLGEQERGPRLEQLVDLPQKPGQIAHLVQNGERQGEVEAAVSPMQADGVLRGFMRFDPVRQAGLGRPPAKHPSMPGCTSTQTTLPPGPTISAIGRLKKPMALPTSRTVMPARTYGDRILYGFCRSFLSRLARK